MGLTGGAMERYNRAMGSEAHVRASEGLSRPYRGATDPEIWGSGYFDETALSEAMVEQSRCNRTY